MAAFGFVKKFKHRDGFIPVEIPKYAQGKDRPRTCHVCDKKFVNTQGLSVHMECIHSVQPVKSDEKAENISKETSFDETEFIVGTVVQKLVEKISSATDKKQQSNHKTLYSAVLKSKVIHYTDKHRDLKGTPMRII